MSLFVGIAFSDEIQNIDQIFGSKVYCEEISPLPFGKTLIYEKKGYRAWIVMCEMDSRSLLDRKKQLKQKHSNLLIDAIRKIVPLSMTVAICCHWFSGSMVYEKVLIREKRVMELKAFEEIFPNLEDDVLYVILKNHPEWSLNPES